MKMIRMNQEQAATTVQAAQRGKNGRAEAKELAAKPRVASHLIRSKETNATILMRQQMMHYNEADVNQDGKLDLINLDATLESIKKELAYILQRGKDLRALESQSLAFASNSIQTRFNSIRFKVDSKSIQIRFNSI